MEKVGGSNPSRTTLILTNMKQYNLPPWLIIVVLLFALELIYLFLKYLVPIVICSGLVLAGAWAYNKYLKGK